MFQELHLHENKNKKTILHFIMTLILQFGIDSIAYLHLHKKKMHAKLDIDFIHELHIIVNLVLSINK